MAQSKQSAAVAKAAAREKLEQYYVGRYRYFHVENGDRLQLPESMFHEWYTPENVMREVCIGLDKENKPVWKDSADAPVPRNAFLQEDNTVSPSAEKPAAAMPGFEYRPPAYASDTQSGGPGNFDGQKGGNDNPRNPDTEGEIPDQYKLEVQQFRESMIAEMEQWKSNVIGGLVESKAVDEKGLEALQALINTKKRE